MRLGLQPDSTPWDIGRRIANTRLYPNGQVCASEQKSIGEWSPYQSGESYLTEVVRVRIPISERAGCVAKEWFGRISGSAATGLRDAKNSGALYLQITCALGLRS